MITMQVSNEMYKIPEADIELLKIMAHPVRLQIVMELERHKICNVTQLVNRAIRCASIYRISAFI